MALRTRIPKTENERPSSKTARQRSRVESANETFGDYGASGLTPRQQAVMRMHQTYGNAAVSQMLAQRVPGFSDSGSANGYEHIHATASSATASEKTFACPDFAGNRKLEDCLNDRDRLRIGDSDASSDGAVKKVQNALLKNDLNCLPKFGADGKYGSEMEGAVKGFKLQQHLPFAAFGDVGPRTIMKLDELCTTGPKPQPTPKDKPNKCVPSADNPFCLPLPMPSDTTPCRPYRSPEVAEEMWHKLHHEIPTATSIATACPEVGNVWETYFAGSSTPFSFFKPSSCVVRAAKLEQSGLKTARGAAEGYLERVVQNLPLTLRQLRPNTSLAGPIAITKLPLKAALGHIGPLYLHPRIEYDDTLNAAADIAGGVGESDKFGPDDREMSGTVTIKVYAVDPDSGQVRGQVLYEPHVHVKDTADFCPGDKGNWLVREATVPMSKLESMDLTRDVPFTIDYDLETMETNFNVAPFYEHGSSRPEKYLD